MRLKISEKTLGYLIRLAAVSVWGLLPLVVRYSPSSSIPDVFAQAGLYFVGGLLFSSTMVIIRAALNPVLLRQLHLPWSHWLPVLLVSEVSIVAFTYISLHLTSGTHFILLNNFAPVFALLVAIVFWRQQIPYLRHRHTQVVMLVIFLLGSLGSSLLFVDATRDSSAGAVEGDLWALGVIVTDVTLIIAQIRYIRRVQPLQIPLVNFYLFLLALPLFFLLFGLNPARLAGLPAEQLGWGIFIGMFGAFGYYLNYEAFRRIDGFLAFLMFNLSILITFCVEAFVLRAIPPSFVLVLGGGLIVGASVWAENINARCEREIQV